MPAVPEIDTTVDVNTEEAVLLGDDLSHEAQDPDEGLLVDAVLSIDSEL